MRVHMCTCVYMWMVHSWEFAHSQGSQRRESFLCYSQPCYPETECLPELEAGTVVRLAGEPVPGIHLSLSPKAAVIGMGNHVRLFTWVLVTQTPVLIGRAEIWFQIDTFFSFCLGTLFTVEDSQGIGIQPQELAWHQSPKKDFVWHGQKWFSSAGWWCLTGALTSVR